jgi:hypothetical protein
MTTMTRHAPGMFCWSQLSTTDPEGARKFYSGLFGWNLQNTPLGGEESYTFLKKNDKIIGALCEQVDEELEQGIAPSWMPYISVENADQTVTKIKQAGGKVLMEPFDAMDSGRVAIVQDPTGGTFALWQPKKNAGAEVVNETNAMCWNELITTDKAKAGAFYKKVFGWNEETMPMPQGGTYTIFKNNTDSAGGMMQATPDMKLTHPYWLVYFAVDDADKTAAKAQQLGGKVKMQPTDIPNVGRFSVLTDPQNVWFAIIKPEPSQKT